MVLVKSSTQKNVVSGGHAVVGDLTINETHNYPEPDSTPKILAELFANYGNEGDLKKEHDEIIDELMRYINPVSIEGSLRDLQTKLREGNREGFLNEGLELKDNFRREIEKYRHSPTGQKIFVFLLAAVRTYFRSKIFHGISELSDAELGQAILSEVIEPTLLQIPSSEPLITQDTLLGMLYFLTGNCFLEWSK